MKKIINKTKSKPAKKPIVVNKAVFNLLSNLIDRVQTLERKQAHWDITIQDYNLRMMNEKIKKIIFNKPALRRSDKLKSETPATKGVSRGKLPR